MSWKILVLLVAIIQLCRALFWFGCMQGYYEQAGRCLQCDSSCKTCSDGDSCEMCEEFMYRSEVTGFCEICDGGRYFSQEKLSCQPCEDSCSGECKYRLECLMCPPDLLFDLETLTCVNSCGPQKIELISQNLTFKAVCKNPEIYIDAFSSEKIELGTLKYPYRNLKSAAIEILQHHSHTNRSLTIYTKEAYLEIDTFRIMNMTLVKIENHPDYKLIGKNPPIIITKDVQEGISKKSRLHLLNNTNLDPTSVINTGSYTDLEQSYFTRPGSGFIISRTNFHISNIDIYSLDKCKNILPIYLQEKEVRLENMYWNSSGDGIYPLEPLNVHLENITADLDDNFLLMLTVEANCNYPEANIKNTFYAKNISDSSSLNIAGFGTMIYITFPGNNTFDSFDCRRQSTNPQKLAACWIMAIFPNCVPYDDLYAETIYNNTLHDGSTIQEQNGFTYLPSFLSHIAPYRRYSIKLENNYISNMSWKESFGIFYFWLSGTEKVFMKNMVFTNITHVPFIFQILNYANCNVDGLHFEKDINLKSKMFEIVSGGNISINNLYLTNFTNFGANPVSPIEIKSGPASNILLRGIYMNSVELFDFPLLNIPTVANQVIITDLYLDGVRFATEESLFYIQTVNSFSMSNLTVRNTTPTDPLDNKSVLLNIATLDIEGMKTADFYDIRIKNSSVSLFKINTFVNQVDTQIPINILSIKYFDSLIRADRALISTQRISVNNTLPIYLSDLEFDGIEFMNSGVLLEIMHQLPNTIQLSESIFNNIISGLIKIEGSRSGGLKTMLSMNNSVFSNIQTPVNAFFTISQSSITNAKNNSFTNFTSTTFISGIMNVFDGANVTIVDSNFTKNSAKTAAIAKVETKAVLKFDNCDIYENFAITNGVFEAASYGLIVIENSSIYRNYAIQYPIGSIILSVYPCKITRTDIYSNEMISKSTIFNETSEDCEKLCFLHQQMKDYLLGDNLDSIEEIEYLFQVLQGNLVIKDSAHISNETLILSAFMSSVSIENAIISDIKSEISSFKILDSNFTMKHTVIENIRAISSRESFILSNSASMEMLNMTYRNSNSQMLIALSSVLELKDVNFDAISDCSYLISTLLCESFQLRNMTVERSNPTQSVMVQIQDTLGITLEQIKLADLNLTFVSAIDSQIDVITDIRISNLSQCFIFTKTNISLLSDSEFVDNYSKGPGGAILMTDSKLKIKNTTFHNNSADEGGAIMFGCTQNDICELDIKQSLFRENSATTKGGAISYNYNPPTIGDTIFGNNSATYGENYASYPARIGYVNSTVDEEIIIEDIGPGLPITIDLKLALIDIDGQVISNDNTSQILILPKDFSNSAISGTNVAQVENGIAQFNNITFEVDRKYKTFNFSISSTSINSDKITKISNKLEQKDLLAKFRDCKPGERIYGKRCEVCAAGTYSLNYNATECAQCSLEAECLGGAQIFLRPGYWRRYHNSTKIVECIDKEACKGEYNSTGSSPSVCAEGYTGDLCGQCSVNSTVKYERVNDFQCRKCPDPVWNGFRVVGLFLIVLAFYVFMVIINVRKTSESELSILLRIFTNYIQLITVSTSMTNNYPSTFIALSYAIRLFGASSEALLSFDCFIRDTDIKFIFDSNAIFKLFLLCLLPAILFLGFALMWIVVNLVKSSWISDLRRNIIISFITIVFILHPKLTENSIRLFSCTNLDDESKVMKIDTNIECFSSTHVIWVIFVATPILVIWVLACPIIAISMIYYSRRRQESSKMAEYFIIISQGFKPNAVYWEFINTLRKIIILFSLLFSLTVGTIISLSMLIITARIEIWIKPYKNNEHCKCELLAIMAGISTITGALIFTQQNHSPNLDRCVLIIIVLANIKFIIEWVYLLIGVYTENNKFCSIAFSFLTKLLCKSKRLQPTENKIDTKQVTQKCLKRESVQSVQSPMSQPRVHKKLLKGSKKVKYRRRKQKKKPQIETDEIQSDDRLQR
ncbi:unnamed protein product [Moneuplotes crassus]|uniref:Uncharacterized protein n=1 Tax=Euplotes crassus TaxID=5936 RepID=A0AAD1XB30_EUPCR|nr:unnamed protein product [Moneuplotes crassus]